MFESIRKEFINYYKTFDIREKKILYKFHHSFRVMEISKEIAISLGLNDVDIEISCVIGLLHDIARFKQWTLYKTFRDKDSFDHGDEGVSILKELDILNKCFIDKSVQEIIYTSIKNHNKYNIEASNKREELFSKIIRDADKIDIMKELIIDFKEDKYELNDNILKDFFNYKLVDNKTVNNPLGQTLRVISFIYDINYKYSLELLKKENIISNRINLLELYCNDKQVIDKITNCINNYMKEAKLC